MLRMSSQTFSEDRFETYCTVADRSVIRRVIVGIVVQHFGVRVF